MGEIGQQRYLTNQRRYWAALACCVVGITGMPSLAATNGTVGATSTGKVGISLRVPPNLRLSGAQDLRLFNSRSDSPSSPMSESRLCVHSDNGQYQLRIQGSGPNSEFFARQGEDTLAISVAYDDGSGLQSVQHNRPLRYLRGAQSATVTCQQSGLNARLVVSPEPQPQRHSQPAQYTGSLTLLVAPE